MNKFILIVFCMAFSVAYCLDYNSNQSCNFKRANEQAALNENDTNTEFKTVKIDGLDIFYREAGSKDNPTILLLHGFPTSSHMFRNLIPMLSKKFHLIAPDYPGFGNSSMPTIKEFDYTFDHLAEVIEKFIDKLGLNKYSLYMVDYGAPIGFRIASKHPKQIQSLIIQNGNAYEEGLLADFWKPFKIYWKDPTDENAKPLKAFFTKDSTKWQYLTGAKNPLAISPDGWNMDQLFLDRPGNNDIQLKLFYSYGSNLALYSQWQKYLRIYQPPTLIVWGKNDQIFPAEGAEAYKKDLKNIDFNLLDTGHFALEEDDGFIAKKIISFFSNIQQDDH